MKNNIFNGLRTLFIVSLCICMLLGAALTFAQLLGVVLQLPWLVEGSERLLLTPAIAAAAAFGLFSFLASYFQAEGPYDDEERDDV